eukprot:scaffold997_cov333-Pavlova_lutheri.AAC.3
MRCMVDGGGIAARQRSLADRPSLLYDVAFPMISSNARVASSRLCTPRGKPTLSTENCAPLRTLTSTPVRSMEMQEASSAGDVLAEFLGEHLDGVQGILLDHGVGLGAKVFFNIHPLHGAEATHEVDIAYPVHAEEAEVPPLCGAVLLMFFHEDRLGVGLQGVVQRVDVPEEGGPGIGQSAPSGHLHGDGAPGIGQYVSRMYGQGRQREQRTAGLVDGEVDDGTERIPGPSVVHLGHDGAQRGVPGLFEQVPHGFGFRGQVSGCGCVGDACRQRCTEQSRRSQGRSHARRTDGVRHRSMEDVLFHLDGHWFGSLHPFSIRTGVFFSFPILGPARPVPAVVAHGCGDGSTSSDVPGASFSRASRPFHHVRSDPMDLCIRHGFRGWCAFRSVWSIRVGSTRPLALTSDVSIGSGIDRSVSKGKDHPIRSNRNPRGTMGRGWNEGMKEWENGGPDHRPRRWGTVPSPTTTVSGSIDP